MKIQIDCDVKFKRTHAILILAIGLVIVTAIGLHVGMNPPCVDGQYKYVHSANDMGIVVQAMDGKTIIDFNLEPGNYWAKYYEICR